MDIDEEPDGKDGDSLLSFNTDTLLSEEKIQPVLEKDYVLSSEKYDIDDADRHNEASPTTVPPTPLNIPPNSKTRRDRNLKRQTLGEEESTVDTNRSTRAKISLQIAVQDKPSLSEETDDL